MVVPVIDKELAIDPEAQAVIGGGDKGVGFGGGGLDLAGPADREVLRGNAGGGIGGPVEIDGGIEF